MKVAFLGPVGTFSQEAAVLAFGNSHTPVFCASLAEVVDTVGAGQAEGAVLPIENSTNGIVYLAIDGLLHSPHLNSLEVCGDVKVLVRHQLYTLASNLSSIEVVYSHPQVWGQTEQWLKRNLPHAKRVDVSSTAQAVQKALSDKQGRSAALGGPFSSKQKPLITNCADDPNNTTRFLVLRRKTANKEGFGHNRVWATTSTTQAALQAQIHSAHVSVSFIALLPSKNAWEYDFLVEFEGTPHHAWTVLGSEGPASKL